MVDTLHYFIISVQLALKHMFSCVIWVGSPKHSICSCFGPLGHNTIVVRQSKSSFQASHVGFTCSVFKFSPLLIVTCVSPTLSVPQGPTCRRALSQCSPFCAWIEKIIRWSPLRNISAVFPPGMNGGEATGVSAHCLLAGCQLNLRRPGEAHVARWMRLAAVLPLKCEPAPFLPRLW